MDKQKTNYHHGNLYQSLVKSAGDMIHEQGIDALSMRKLADYIGVSRTAPYHHFKDKNQLLCAIAEAGFELQDEIVSPNTPATKPHLFKENTDSIGLLELEQLVQSYIQFATSHPAHYDLMYGGRIWKEKLATESLEAASRKSFKHWLERIEKLQHQNILSQQESTLRIAQVAWATLHGLCRLANDGVYIDSDDVMEMGKSAARMMLSSRAPGA